MTKPEGVVGDHGEEEFVGEKIGDAVWRGSKLWFRVKWMGYQKETLQRAEILVEDVREKMRKYMNECEDQKVSDYLSACLRR